MGHETEIRVSRQKFVCTDSRLTASSEKVHVVKKYLTRKERGPDLFLTVSGSVLYMSVVLQEHNWFLGVQL